jgi:hypothetical protein
MPLVAGQLAACTETDANAIISITAAIIADVIFFICKTSFRVLLCLYI